MADVAGELGMRVIRIRPSMDAPAGVFELARTEGASEQPHARQTDAVLLFHTSSTSGSPKLVPRSRACVRVAATQDSDALELTASDRFLSLMPLCYAHGISAIFTQLVRGASAFCPAAFDADQFLSWLEEFRPTWFSADPTLQRAILTLAQKHPQVFSRAPLRFIRSAGAAPHPDIVRSLEELLGVPVLDGYGLTEMPSVARNTPSRRKPGSVGTSSGAEIAVMDDAGRPLSVGSEGEIVVRGSTLMAGYLDDPEANQQAFRDGWFRTGDLGRLDNEGYLFIVGRRKEMINRGGKKILPQEVESVLTSHPCVAAAAAFGIPHRTLGEDVAAAVVLRPDDRVKEVHLRWFAAKRLAVFKVPRRIVFVEEIPCTATGKPKRAALAEQFQNLASKSLRNDGRSQEALRAPTEVEGKLIEIWRNVLGLENVGIHEDFFELGGDSLSAAIMLAQASECLKIGRSKLGEAELWERPTIAMLARTISRNRERESASIGEQIIVLRSEGKNIPFFCFPTTEIQAFEFRHVSRELGPEQPFFAVCPPPAVQGKRLMKLEELARQSAASILAARPDGPYLLGGCCRSSVFALETARQLIARGKEVALLVFFEAPAPGYPKIARHWREYAHQGILLLRELIRGDCKSGIRAALEHFRRLRKLATRRIRAKADRALAPRRREIPEDEKHWNAVVRREYIPRAVPVSIVHFLAANAPVSARILSDPRFGWREFTKKQFDVRWFPSDSLSIFTEDNAALLAEKLREVFAAASVQRERPGIAASARAGADVH